MPRLKFLFDDAGVLRCDFLCDVTQQGYDGMVHGGVIAAIIDASMAQCLMGHGIPGYTADLNVRYRKPVRINAPASLSTLKTGNKAGLFMMNSVITQNQQVAIKATGRFFRVKQSMM